MVLVDNGGNRLSIPFSNSTNREAKFGDHLKKALILRSESVTMLIRGVVAATRVVRKSSKSVSIAFRL